MRDVNQSKAEGERVREDTERVLAQPDRDGLIDRRASEWLAGRAGYYTSTC